MALAGQLRRVAACTSLFSGPVFRPAVAALRFPSRPPPLAAAMARSADASGSARQRASGWRSGEGAEAGQQLTVGERPALLDRDPPMMSVALVLGTHLVREVVDHLAVTDEQQVVIGRQRARNLVE